jgi:hypothetical protein
LPLGIVVVVVVAVVVVVEVASAEVATSTGEKLRTAIIKRKVLPVIALPRIHAKYDDEVTVYHDVFEKPSPPPMATACSGSLSWANPMVRRYARRSILRRTRQPRCLSIGLGPSDVRERSVELGSDAQPKTQSSSVDPVDKIARSVPRSMCSWNGNLRGRCDAT